MHFICCIVHMILASFVHRLYKALLVTLVFTQGSNSKLDFLHCKQSSTTTAASTVWDLHEPGIIQRGRLVSEHQSCC